MELECRERESPGRTWKPSEPTASARVAMRSDLESGHKLTLTPAASGLSNVSKQFPEGVERLDRRSEVLNEAIAKEVARNV